MLGAGFPDPRPLTDRRFHLPAGLGEPHGPPHQIVHDMVDDPVGIDVGAVKAGRPWHYPLPPHGVSTTVAAVMPP